MEKVVILDLDGDLKKGVSVTLEIRLNGETQTRAKGKLPSRSQLSQQYRDWQSLYRNLGFLFRLEDRWSEVENNSPDAVFTACRQSAQQLAEQFNLWLRSESFRPIREKLLEKLLPDDFIRVILQVEGAEIRRLPWHLWDFFERYPQAEIALGATAYEQPINPKKSRERARILAVLGHNSGIDVRGDRALLQQLTDHAEIVFLVEPYRQELYEKLWDLEGWDILFFAGHSSSQADGEKGIIEINSWEKLSLDELTHALRKAVAQGLQIAIFNSCDGLGLAKQLERLHIPQTIVMREPVPDLVAREFLKHFLAAFCRGNSFYLSVREAREKLQSLEDRCPCATWLPAICQNPAAIPLTWQALTQADIEIETAPQQSCPYRGLAAFSVQDAPFFFGREAFAQQLVQAAQNRPLITVIGASGSGKSSVVFAGLLPRLPGWAIAAFRPGDRPFFRLAEQLIPLLEPELTQTAQLVEVKRLAAAFQQGELSLADISNRLLQQTPQATRFLLVADQFEELYALGREEAAIAFPDLLLNAVRSALNFTLILTLRADFLEYALSHSPFAAALCQYPPELLGPMNREQLRAAVEKPAAQLGVTLADGLTERILDAVEREPGNLPLLEFALTLLWEQQERGRLTHAAYDRIGGVEGALAGYAEQVYEQLNETEQEQAQRIFTQLVRPGEGTADTRRVAIREELGETCKALINHLATARLVVCNHAHSQLEIPLSQNTTPPPSPISETHESPPNCDSNEPTHTSGVRGGRNAPGGGSGGQNPPENLGLNESVENPAKHSNLKSIHLKGGGQNPPKNLGFKKPPKNSTPNAQTQQDETVEIVHEALIREWERLRQWLEDDRAFRVWQERSRLGMREWENNAEEEGLLLHGTPLLAAKQWLQDRPQDLSDREKTYIAASLAFQQREAQVKMSLRRKIAIAFAIGLMGSLSLAGIAAWQWQRAEMGELGFLLNTLSSSSEELFASNKELEALLESIRAAKELKEQIRRSQNPQPNTQIRAIAALHQAVYGIREYNRLEGHEQTVIAAAFSPDGQTLASASDDGTVKLWQRNGAEIATLQGHRDRVRSVAFSPDGQTLASASYDKTVKLWNAQGAALATLTHEDKVNSVAWSADGQYLVSASTDGTVKIWQFQNGQPQLLYRWKAHRSWISAAKFHPNGRLLATASADKTVKLWRLNGSAIDTLRGHQEGVKSLAFSPDGESLATASSDNTAKIWHLDGTLIATLDSHEDRVWSVTWSPDGRTLATASADKTLKLWQQDGRELATLKGHNATAYSATWSPDGKTLASTSADTTIKLWHPDSQPLLALGGHEGAVRDVAFSPDGKFIATAGASGVVKLWQRELDSDPGIQSLPTSIDLDGEVWTVRFNPQSSLLAAASDKGTVQLWKIQAGARPQLKLLKTLRVLSGVWALSFSPDGKFFATSGPSNAIQIWRADGTPAQTLRSDRAGIMALAFSPDGQMLAAAGEDKTIEIWQSEIDSSLYRSLDRNAPSNWKRDYFSVQITLTGHSSRVWDIAWSPDRRTLVSASTDGTLKLWRYNGRGRFSSRPYKTLKGHLNKVNSVSFSSDRQILVSGSADGTVKLWSANGTLLKTLKGHQGGIWSVRFSPRERVVASASEDGRVILWDLDLDRLLERGCSWVEDYLETNATLSDRDRALCQS